MTNLDTNYSPLRTLLTPLRQYRYRTTTNYCPLTWNRCSPVFHFNWLWTVLRTLLRTLLLNYHNLQTTLWTYSTSVWPPLTFSKRQTLQTVTRYSYGLSSFCCCDLEVSQVIPAFTSLIYGKKNEKNRIINFCHSILYFLRASSEWHFFTPCLVHINSYLSAPFLVKQLTIKDNAWQHAVDWSDFYF